MILERWDGGADGRGDARRACLWAALLDRWEDLAKLTGFGGLGYSLWRVLPRAYRAVIALLAAKVQLDIEREKNRAREEQVADLLDIIRGRDAGEKS